MMDEMNKKIKMELLEKLMSEMDDFSSSKLGKKEPVAEVTKVESKEMPLSDVKDMIKEKLENTQDEEQENPEEEKMESPDEKLAELMHPEMEQEESPEDDEDYGDSRMMQKLKELKMIKK